MLINDIMTPSEVLDAWEDTVGDIGWLLERVEMMLNGEELSCSERMKLERLQDILEEVQECY